MIIRGREVDVDIAHEIKQHDWRRGKYVEGKFLACSPFRSETHPSFGVRLDNGVWIDSGSDSPTWKKGNFVKLLAWLRNETYEETEEYLLGAYSYFTLIPADSLQLKFELKTDQAKRPLLPAEMLNEYCYRHPYLEAQRGIEERVQRAFQVGYSKNMKAITLPWFDKYGNLMNVKYRSIEGKQFWYAKGGHPIKNHLYGLNWVYRKGSKSVYIVESEIDALTLWGAGFAAVAMGGSAFNDAQRKLMLKSPVEEFVVATDNDNVGRKIANDITKSLNGYKFVKRMWMPEHIKDVNDMTREELLDCAEKAKQNTLSFEFGK